MMANLKDLWCGIARHPLKAGGYIFTTFSILFTIIRGITHFIPDIKIEGPYALAAVITVSVFFGLKKVWKPSKIQLKIANSNTIIEIIFGDLFLQEGLRAIAVNEFFDSQIGKPVSDKSLHGIFLQKCFGGHPESFDKQVDQQLQTTVSSHVQKSEGKTKSFPIGSTAIITVNEDRYLLFALSKTDPTTLKADSDVTCMWNALHKLWKRAREEANGHSLNVPLVGGGLSGVGLPTRDLLNLIILSAITETKTNLITQKIRIVLLRDRFEDLDLRDVKEHWEK